MKPSFYSASLIPLFNSCDEIAVTPPEYKLIKVIISYNNSHLITKITLVMNLTMKPIENQFTSKAQMMIKSLNNPVIMTEDKAILIGCDIIGQMRSDEQRVMSEEEI